MNCPFEAPSEPNLQRICIGVALERPGTANDCWKLIFMSSLIDEPFAMIGEAELDNPEKSFIKTLSMPGDEPRAINALAVSSAEILFVLVFCFLCFL